MGRGFRSEIVVGLCVCVLFLVGAIFFNAPRQSDPIQSLRSWQDADAPVGYPVGAAKGGDGKVPTFDHRFVLHDVFTRFLVPPSPLLAPNLHQCHSGQLAASDHYPARKRQGLRHSKTILDSRLSHLLALSVFQSSRMPPLLAPPSATRREAPAPPPHPRQRRR